jgi:type II secretion system protein G
MKRKGFTLIEILVVIGIIGLLAVFLVPNLLGAQDRAKETAVKAVMHSLQLAVEAYNMENDSYPVARGAGVENCARTIFWPAAIYLRSPKIPSPGRNTRTRMSRER